jgi:hypothetical protein
MLTAARPVRKRCISMVEPMPLSMLVVPESKMTESEPSSVMTSISLSAISSRAWSQLSLCQRPEPRSPTRFIG